VNDCPKIYCKNPTEESHAIVAEDEYEEDVILLFYLRGVTSHLDTKPLSREEYEAHESLGGELINFWWKFFSQILIFCVLLIAKHTQDIGLHWNHPKN